MRSSIGPCGLDSQRFLASEISSPQTERARKTTSRAANRIGSKRMRTLAACKAQEGRLHFSLDAAPEREHLEQLAHLGRGEQLLRLGGDRRVMQRVLQVGFSENIGDAAVHEELRLGRVAENLQAAVARGARERAEVDVGGDVLPAG